MAKVNQALQDLLTPNTFVQQLFKEGREGMAMAVYLRQVSDLGRDDLLKILAESARLGDGGGA